MTRDRRDRATARAEGSGLPRRASGSGAEDGATSEGAALVGGSHLAVAGESAATLRAEAFDTRRLRFLCTVFPVFSRVGHKMF